MTEMSKEYQASFFGGFSFPNMSEYSKSTFFIGPEGDIIKDSRVGEMVKQSWKNMIETLQSNNTF